MGNPSNKQSQQREVAPQQKVNRSIESKNLTETAAQILGGLSAHCYSVWRAVPGLMKKFNDVINDKATNGPKVDCKLAFDEARQSVAMNGESEKQKTIVNNFCDEIESMVDGSETMTA